MRYYEAATLSEGFLFPADLFEGGWRASVGKVAVEDSAEVVVD